MLEGILQRYALQPSEVAMVGDRIYTDIQLARNAHVMGILLLTGEATTDDVKTGAFYPDILIRDLSVLDEHIQEAKKAALVT
jgi:NagD protein